MPKNKGSDHNIWDYLYPVFDMANGTCLKSAEATLNKVQLTYKYYTMLMLRDNSIFLSWL